MNELVEDQKNVICNKKAGGFISGRGNRILLLSTSELIDENRPELRN